MRCKSGFIQLTTHIDEISKQQYMYNMVVQNKNIKCWDHLGSKASNNSFKLRMS